MLCCAAPPPVTMLWCIGLVLVGAVHFCSANVKAVDELPWWKTATLYQIYPRSFKDSDGDGIGDLRGITQMVGYFKEIGVDAVWLSPIYKSPMVDFGYDISNFTDIDPIFGTMDDFHELLRTFREHDIKVLLDCIPNHSSDQHPWFQKSLQNDSDYRDFYVWRNARYINGTRMPPNNWLSIFVGSAWEWSEQRQQYYLHQFSTKQPELNYRNLAVWGNMSNIMEFWLDKGVDGLRMDAVKHLYEAANCSDEPAARRPGPYPTLYDTLEHIYTTDQPETYALLHHWADLLFRKDQVDGRKRMMLLEIYDPTTVVTSYYGVGNESLSFPFNFNLLIVGSLQSRSPDLKMAIEDWITHAPNGSQLTWVVSNHDNPRIADKYGTEMVDAINALTGVLPGIMVTYNGEEIGMRDTFVRWDETVDPIAKNLGPDHFLEYDRDPERTPMQWDDTISAGFSTNPIAWLPINPNYWYLNVQTQRDSDKSHLKVFQAVTKARKDPVLMYGDLNILTPDNDTLVVVRSYQESYFVLIINMGSQVRTYTSQNLFAVYNLDFSMYVVTSSIQCSYYPGFYQPQGSIDLILRPKAAVLLTTKIWNPSTTTPTPTTTPKPSGASRLLAASPALTIVGLLSLIEWLTMH